MKGLKGQNKMDDLSLVYVAEGTIQLKSQSGNTLIYSLIWDGRMTVVCFNSFYGQIEHVLGQDIENFETYEDFEENLLKLRNFLRGYLTDPDLLLY